MTASISLSTFSPKIIPKLKIKQTPCCSNDIIECLSISNYSYSHYLNLYRLSECLNNHFYTIYWVEWNMLNHKTKYINCKWFLLRSNPNDYDGRWWLLCSFFLWVQNWPNKKYMLSVIGTGSIIFSWDFLVKVSQ